MQILLESHVDVRLNRTLASVSMFSPDGFICDIARYFTVAVRNTSSMC